jgi:isopenicillin N synthase-like dioxygenase
MSATSVVPTIDIGPFLRGDAAGRAVADQVARTCERTGFLIIAGHGFPLDLLERAQRLLFAFFELPEDAKNRWHPTGPSRQRGYHGFATRGLAGTLGQQTPPDLRETVFLGPVDDHRGYYAGMPEAATSYALNLIPTEPAGLEPTLVALYRAYERLAGDMMRVFAAALRLPETFFDGVLARHFSIMSCHHYPVLSQPPLPGQLRTGAHTDYGAMTILAATDAEGGLEVRLPDGSWAGVEPAAVDRHVRASELRPAHRVRADLPRAGREAPLPGDHGGRAHQAQDRAQPRDRVTGCRAQPTSATHSISIFMPALSCTPQVVRAGGSRGKNWR